jgi:sialic acid synthase SpsE
MTTSIEHIEFQTAAQLIAAIEKLAGSALKLDEIYVKDLCGDELSEVALEQETLSDGSLVFNLVLSEAMDPNS